ncbi:hypothetical protein, partial [Allomesorhizobium alhagi]|uniref:hypothetical protein n=1 Tax=Allomesorhizobium alhagi TaxID=475067 RepID=UPI001AEC4F3B
LLQPDRQKTAAPVVDNKRMIMLPYRSFGALYRKTAIWPLASPPKAAFGAEQHENAHFAGAVQIGRGCAI